MGGSGGGAQRGGTRGMGQTCAWLSLIVFAVRVLREGVCGWCVCQCGKGARTVG